MLNHQMVTVVLTVFEREAFLPLAIQSVLWQSYPHWELRIYADGPSLASRSIVESVQAQRAEHAPPIYYAEHVRRPGCWGNHLRAIGLDEAVGGVVTFLSHDCLLHPAFLEWHMRAQTTRPCVAVSQTNYWSARDAENRPTAYARYVGIWPTADPNVARVGQVDAHCLSYPTEVARRCNAFAGNLQQHSADFNMFETLRKQLPVTYIPHQLAMHA